MRDELTSVFGSDGPLAATLPHFRPRGGQLALARAIDQCLDDGSDLVAEAATGTGKTLAYLVPVLLRGVRTIVSTGTLNLQDQLYRRDLPLTLRALGLERRIALLKGRSNYLCPQRLERHLNASDQVDQDLVEPLRQVARWARQTTSGEIGELGDIPAGSSVWPLVTSTQDNCLGGECPHLADCPLVKARRRAQDADLVVVNHHLLFADLALKRSGFGEVLPGADAVIVDEAHQVPDTALRFFSRGVSAWQLRELLRDTLAACGQVAGALHSLRAPVASARGALEQSMSACSTLPARGEFGLLGACLGEFRHLMQAFGALHAALDPIAEQSRDLASCAQRAEILHGELAAFLAGQEGHVRWFSARRGRFQLNLTPLDVAGPLAQLRGRTGCAVDHDLGNPGRGSAL